MPNWVHQSWTHALRIPIDVCRNQIPPLGGTLKYPPICPPARKLRPTVSQECPTQYLHACPPAQAGTFLTLHLVSPSPQAIQPRFPTKGDGSSKGAVKGVSSKGASRGSSKGFQGVVKGVHHHSRLVTILGSTLHSQTPATSAASAASTSIFSEANRSAAATKSSAGKPSRRLWEYAAPVWCCMAAIE